QNLLGPDAELFSVVYGVEPEGNWEHGKNILHRTKTFAQCARLYQHDEADLRRLLARGRQTLFDVRTRRVWPGRDETVRAAGNARRVGASAGAPRVPDEPAHADRAVRAADFLLQRMRSADGRLLRTWSTGNEARLNGYLEDYSFLIDSLVTVY